MGKSGCSVRWIVAMVERLPPFGDGGSTPAKTLVTDGLDLVDHVVVGSGPPAPDEQRGADRAADCQCCDAELALLRMHIAPFPLGRYVLPQQAVVRLYC
jgi:hypothetical protein